MQARIPVALATILLSLLAGFTSLHADDAKDLEEHLKHQLSNQVVHIRNSYGDDHLSYDSQGKLIGNAEQDCPNATELRVRKVEIKKNMLVLRGPRVVKAYSLIGGPLTGFQEQGAEVQIDIELDPAQIHEESVNDILKKVFLTTEDMPKNKPENKEDIRDP